MTGPIFKLLIVDDEAEIREGINRIPWEKDGLMVVGLATNGREALELVAAVNPDIMLLDIRMPVMNGLEVLEKLPVQNGLPKVLILSGYDDFEYCQQALRRGVSDYLLKPCRPIEILAAVKRIKLELLEEERQNNHRQILQQHFQENLEVAREKLLVELIRHQPVDQEASQIRWYSYQMAIPPQNIGVVLVRIDNLKDSEDPERLEYPSSEGHILRNHIREFFNQPPVCHHIIFDYQDDLLLLWDLTEEPIEEFAQRMEKLRHHLEVGLPKPQTVTIGFGGTAQDLSQLSTAFNLALLAVEEGFWAGPNRIILTPKTATADQVESNSFVQAQNAIIQSVRTNDQGQLGPALDVFFEKLTQQGSKTYTHKMVTALICAVDQICMGRGIKTEKFFGPNLMILDELQRSKTLYELKDQVSSCLYRIIEAQPLHKIQWKVVNQALKYMSEHYAEELSLETVAQQVYVSSGYLSTIFKQVLQQNFVDSLHEVRVEQAKELLRDPRFKVYEVAVRVGYKDEKYFSQIFKKVTGMSPHQFRETTE